MTRRNDKLMEACLNAREAFDKLEDNRYTEIKSKLDFVVGSYTFDKNPIGLYEFGGIALGMLKEIKIQHPRKVTAKVISTLEKYLSE